MNVSMEQVAALSHVSTQMEAMCVLVPLDTGYLQTTIHVMVRDINVLFLLLTGTDWYEHPMQLLLLPSCMFECKLKGNRIDCFTIG